MNSRFVRIVKFIVFLPPGVLLYLLSGGFRNTVKAKLSAKGSAGEDVVISSGETVVAVLAGSQNKTIGGE